MTTDPVVAYLAEASRVVSDRYADAGERAAFAPPLLAAVNAVLKVAAELCKDTPCSSALDEDRMWGRQEHGRQIIRAISKELTGTGGSDSGG